MDRDVKPNQLESLQHYRDDELDSPTYEPPGCHLCHGTGYVKATATELQEFITSTYTIVSNRQRSAGYEQMDTLQWITWTSDLWQKFILTGAMPCECS